LWFGQSAHSFAGFFVELEVEVEGAGYGLVGNVIVSGFS
jgi:hypothetical protein